MKTIIGVLAVTILISLACTTLAGTERSVRSTKLEAAIKQSNIRETRSLLNSGVDPNFRDSDGKTPLITAVIIGRADMVRLLLSNHADPEGRGKEGMTPLIAAAWLGSVDSMNLILNAHANINSVDATGMSALLVACNRCAIAPVRLLLNRGANVHYIDGTFSPLNSVVSGVVNRAQDASVLAVANALLDHGADINSEQDHGDTPLMGAMRNRDTMLTRLLIDRGADVNLIGRSHPESPLMLAVKVNDIPTATLLIDHGAKVAFTLQNGESALSIAKSRSEARMLTLLERADRK